MKKFLVIATLSVIGFLLFPSKTFAHTLNVSDYMCSTIPDKSIFDGLINFDSTDMYLIYKITGTYDYWLIRSNETPANFGITVHHNEPDSFSYENSPFSAPHTLAYRRNATTLAWNLFSSPASNTTMFTTGQFPDRCFVSARGVSYGIAASGTIPDNYPAPPPEPEPEPEPSGGISDERIAKFVGVVLGFALCAHVLNMIRYRGYNA